MMNQIDDDRIRLELGKMRRRFVLLVCLLCLAVAQVTTGTTYSKEEAVPMWANKVGPYSSPSETYSFYHLPACQPPQIQHEHETLGEVLGGDDLQSSLYDIRFRGTQYYTPHPPHTPHTHPSPQEFDITKGNTIGARYPGGRSLEIDDELIACLCLPDGAHIHEEDYSHFFLHPPPHPHSAAEVAAAGKVSRVLTRSTYFGTAVFANVADPSVDRGAIQQAMVVVTRVPYFAELREILRHAVHVVIDVLRGESRQWGASREAILEIVHTTLNLAIHRELQVEILGRVFRLNNVLTTSLGGSAGSVSQISAEDQEGEDETAQMMRAVGGRDSMYGLSSRGSGELEWDPTEYTGVSLSHLVRTFGVETMILWYALLLRRRILFTGQPAGSVCNMVLACPHLIAPLQVDAAKLAPYVCLQDTSPVENPGTVAGTTNLLFATREDWYDVHGALTTGSIVLSSRSDAGVPIKLGSGDKKFIKNVLTGLEEDSRSEPWVRTQFAHYTRAFLRAIDTDTLKGAQAKHLSGFMSDPMYTRYLVAAARSASESNENEKGSDTNNGGNGGDGEEGGNGGDGAPSGVAGGRLAKVAPRISAADVRAAVGMLLSSGSTLSPVQLQHAVFELDKALANVEHLEEATRVGAVGAVKPFINHSSAQVRKYAVSVLGKLACSIQGQMSILQHEVLDDIIPLVGDARANVADAAAKTLLRVGGLFIGAHALASKGMVPRAKELVLGEDTPLTVKTSAIRLLSRIYQLVPDLEFPSEAEIREFHLQLYNESPDLRASLFLLLDLWGASLPGLPSTRTVDRFLNALCVEDQVTRTDASCLILSQLASQPLLNLEFVARGGIEVVLQNLRPAVNIDVLVTASFCLLSRMAGTSLGRRRMLHHMIVPKAVDALGAVSPVLAFVAAEFLETLTQFEEVGELVVSDAGLPALYKAALRALADPHARPLALPALTALRNALLLVPGSFSVLSELVGEDREGLGPPGQDPELDLWVESSLAGLYEILEAGDGMGEEVRARLLERLLRDRSQFAQ